MIDILSMCLAITMVDQGGCSKMPLECPSGRDATGGMQRNPSV